MGEQQLPWEMEGRGKAMLKRAGRFKDAVLGLLHRDPAERVLVRTFMRQYASIMAPTTMQGSELESRRPNVAESHASEQNTTLVVEGPCLTV